MNSNWFAFVMIFIFQAKAIWWLKFWAMMTMITKMLERTKRTQHRNQTHRRYRRQRNSNYVSIQFYRFVRYHFCVGRNQLHFWLWTTDCPYLSFSLDVCLISYFDLCRMNFKSVYSINSIVCLFLAFTRNSVSPPSDPIEISSDESSPEDEDQAANGTGKEFIWTYAQNILLSSNSNCLCIDRSSPSRDEMCLPKSQAQNGLIDGRSSEDSHSTDELNETGVKKIWSSQAVDKTSKWSIFLFFSVLFHTTFQILWIVCARPKCIESPWWTFFDNN